MAKAASFSELGSRSRISSLTGAAGTEGHAEVAGHAPPHEGQVLLDVRPVETR
jgi:hypothetical protein